MIVKKENKNDPVFNFLPLSARTNQAKGKKILIDDSQPLPLVREAAGRLEGVGFFLPLSVPVWDHMAARSYLKRRPLSGLVFTCSRVSNGSC